LNLKDKCKSLAHVSRLLHDQLWLSGFRHDTLKLTTNSKSYLNSITLTDSSSSLVSLAAKIVVLSCGFSHFSPEDGKEANHIAVLSVLNEASRNTNLAWLSIYPFEHIAEGPIDVYLRLLSQNMSNTSLKKLELCLGHCF